MEEGFYNVVLEHTKRHIESVGLTSPQNLDLNNRLIYFGHVLISLKSFVETFHCIGSGKFI